MAEKKETKFDKWLSKLLYTLIVAGHHEDYVTEQNGKVVITPADVWHKNALENNR